MAGSGSIVPAPGDDGESPGSTPTSGGRLGGWTTLPFFLATLAALTLSAGGWLSNTTVFLIKEFNIKSIDATQIVNLVFSCMLFCPIIAAIIADSCLGCFFVIFISSLLSLMGIVILVLSVTIDSLRPPICNNIGTVFCTGPSKLQYALLYTALALATIGQGGARFMLATMGANQFKNPKHQATYFSWYFIVVYVVSLVSATAIVYIEDNVGWTWGLGIGLAAGFLAIAIFLAGNRFYYHEKPQGSPLTSFARVVIASIRKRKVRVSPEIGHYYYGDEILERKAEAPSNSLMFFNRAALITNEEEILKNYSVSNPWKLCSVQQVEDFKALLRICPLWSTGIFVSTPIAIQGNFSILQALTMDRHLTPRFQIPAGSLMVFPMLSTSISIVLLERVVWPVWKKYKGRNATPLQQIGVGHIINVASMALSALVESRRKSTFYSHKLQGSEIVPMSVLWLVPQLAVVGIGEAFHFPGQIAFYYQEFPTCLKSMGSAMISLLLGIAFYLSTAVIEFVRVRTRWLPDNINHGRIENMYWVLVVLGTLNFGYYLLCAWLYKYKNVEQVTEDL